MSSLFQPLSLREVTLVNRITVSPMCQYSADEGSATAWHHAHLGSLALSGAALLTLEATGVTPAGRITPACLGLWSDENEEALAAVIKTVRAASPIKLGIQLAHAGRKASSALPWEGGQLLSLDQGGWITEAPSAVPHAAHERKPHALSVEELATLRDAFAMAAKRAARLGFDAIEVHAAHGYLLHQFLSPVSNQREDQYGGSLENRMRFPLEVFDAIRAAFPADKPVGVRVSASDWLNDRPSWNIEQTLAFAAQLKTRGCDWIDASSGGISPDQKIELKPGYQVDFARAIKRATGLPTIAVGLITDPAQAEKIIADGEADMVALARGMLADPHWPWRAATALDGTITAPRQYWRALPSGPARIFGNVSIGQR